MGDYYTDWYKKMGIEQPGSSSNSQFKNYLSSGVTGMLGQSGFKEPEKYSKFITEYNPFEEIMAQRNYDTQMSEFDLQRKSLSQKYSTQIGDLLRGYEGAQSKGGFASSGGLDKEHNRMRSGLGFDYMSGVKGVGLGRESSATGLWGAVESSRSDYINNLYEQMADLVQGGAKMESPSAPAGTGGHSAAGFDFGMSGLGDLSDLSGLGTVPEGLGSLNLENNPSLNYLASHPEYQSYYWGLIGQNKYDEANNWLSEQMKNNP